MSIQLNLPTVSKRQCYLDLSVIKVTAQTVTFNLNIKSNTLKDDSIDLDIPVEIHFGAMLGIFTEALEIMPISAISYFSSIRERCDKFLELLQNVGISQHKPSIDFFANNKR